MKQLKNLRKYNPFGWIIAFFIVGLIVIQLTFGFLFFFLGKLFKGLGYFFTFNFYSAKQEFKDFWSIGVDIRDALKY